MNALELHEKLNAAHARQRELLDAADASERIFKAERAKMSEWAEEHEADAIRKLRAEAKELVFSINGMRAMLRKTRIDVTAEGGQ